jgi:hypothetical protein
MEGMSLYQMRLGNQTKQYLAGSVSGFASRALSERLVSSSLVSLKTVCCCPLLQTHRNALEMRDCR